MEGTEIKRFNAWASSDDSDMESILGTTRQIAHLAGVRLEPKGRLRKQDGSMVAKFSVGPKPLKWKGSTGWERAQVLVKHDEHGAWLLATVDGSPVVIAPGVSWQPIRKSAEVIERVHNKLRKDGGR